MKKLSLFQYFTIGVVSLGGFLFGYNLAVIAGALHFLAAKFHLSALHQGMLVATPLFGALLGSSFAGYIADKFGRRRALFLTSLLFFLGALITTVAPAFWLIMLGRLVAGLAVGIVSLTAPLYLAEMAPPDLRGGIVSVNQLAITVGIFVAYLVNLICCESEAWRLMFAFALLPAILQFISLFFLPEIQFSKAKGSSLRTLFTPSVMKLLLIGIGLCIFQQITGINGVVFFAPTIFAKAGFTSHSTAVFATVGIGVVNVLATVIALKLLDRAGRRLLLLVGLIGMAVSLLLVALAFSFNAMRLDLIAVIGLMSYVAFFAMSIGPITWLILAEIYPLSIRGRAMSIATFSNWLFCFLLSFSFLHIFEGLGTEGTFFLFASTSIVGAIFVFRYVPETKGRSLEEIEKQLTKGG